MKEEAKSMNASQKTDVVKTQIRRTPEERIAELEMKIEKANAQIKTCELKIEDIKNPKHYISKAKQLKTIIDKAKETMTLEEIARKLGITL